MYLILVTLNHKMILFSVLDHLSVLHIYTLSIIVQIIHNKM